jgi:hypothetical protein
MTTLDALAFYSIEILRRIGSYLARRSVPENELGRLLQMSSTKDQIVEAATRILSTEDEGLTSSELSMRIWKEFEGTSISEKIAPGKGWVNRSIYFHAMSQNPNFFRPRRGFYRHKMFQHLPQ